MSDLPQISTLISSQSLNYLRECWMPDCKYTYYRVDHLIKHFEDSHAEDSHINQQVCGETQKQNQPKNTTKRYKSHTI